MRFGFTAMALCATLVGCAICFAPAPAAAHAQREEALAQGPTPIDAWITRPNKIELTSEQRLRVGILKLEYLAEFDELGGDNQMRVVIQARELETRYRKLVHELLTPEQQAAFDENVRAGG